MTSGIRQYDPLMSVKPQMDAFLIQEGVVLHKACPAPHAVMVSATLHEGICVRFDLRVWLERHTPAAGLVNISLLPSEELLSYFRYVQPVLTLKLPGVSQVLENIAPLQEKPDEMASWPLAFDAGFATVWLDGWPTACRQACRGFNRRALPAYITGTLLFTGGNSTLSSRYLNRLQCGDAILINHAVHEVIVNNHVLFTYRFVEEGIMIEDVESGDPQPERFTPVMSGAKGIPVKLHFVMHEMEMTLQTLSEVMPGDVLPCAPFKEKHVSIYANGMHIAKGAIVMLDGRMGVEIQTLD